MKKGCPSPRRQPRFFNRKASNERLYTRALIRGRSFFLGAGNYDASLKSPLCLWELDILWHSIRKLRTYEEIHTVFTRYLRCDGVYRFLSARGNDRYGRTR